MKSDRSFSKDFLLVVIGQIISLFGNQILRYALPLYLLNQTGSSALFGTISACAFIPMIVLFPVGGIIADRVNKRNIMVMLDFATAALIVLFYVMAGTVDIVPLMAVTMMVLYGIQGAYQPAVKASVPISGGYRPSDAGEFSDRCDQLPGQYGWAGDWRHSVLGCRAGADSVRKHGLLPAFCNYGDFYSYSI